MSYALESGVTDTLGQSKVVVQNTAGAGAVNVQDGGNSLTVDATSWPLPTGASTSALQTSGAQKTQLVDGSGNVITADSQAGDFRLDVASHLVDNHNHQGEISFMRDLRVGQANRLVGTAFIGTTIDSNFWTATVGATGTVTQADHDVTLTTSTSANSFAALNSVRIARFVFAHPHIWRAAVRNPVVVVANNSRQWGAFTHTAGIPQNGFYFSVNASGVLSINSVKAGTPTSVASGSFNGEVASYTLDTNLHAYEIHYFLMKVEFFIDNVLIHTLTPTTSNMIGAQNLQASAVSINNVTAGTAGALDIHAMIILRVGQLNTQPTSSFSTGTQAALVLKRGGGVLYSISLMNIVNTAAVTLWDNTAASGTTLLATGAMGNNTTPFSIDLHGMPFFTGLTLQVATAGANIVIIYE